MANIAELRENILQAFSGEDSRETVMLYDGISLLNEPRWQSLGAMMCMSVLPEWQRRELVSMTMKRLEMSGTTEYEPLLKSDLALLQQQQWRPLGMKLIMDVLPDTDRQAVASLVLHRAEELRYEWEGGAD